MRVVNTLQNFFLELSDFKITNPDFLPGTSLDFSMYHIRPNKHICSNKRTPPISFLMCCESRLPSCLSQLCASLSSVAMQYFIVLQLVVNQ